MYKIHLTPWSRVFLHKLTFPQLVKKITAICETRRFITAFTTAPPPLHILRQFNPVHALPSYLKIDFNTCHLHLGLESNIFPVSFPTKTVHAPLPYSIRTISSAVLDLGEIRVQKCAHNAVGCFITLGKIGAGKVVFCDGCN